MHLHVSLICVLIYECFRKRDAPSLVWLVACMVVYVALLDPNHRGSPEITARRASCEFAACFLGWLACLVSSAWENQEDFVVRRDLLRMAQTVMVIIYPEKKVASCFAACSFVGYIWTTWSVCGSEALNVWFVINQIYQIVIIILFSAFTQLNHRECILMAFNSQDADSLVSLACTEGWTFASLQTRDSGAVPYPVQDGSPVAHHPGFPLIWKSQRRHGQTWPASFIFMIRHLSAVHCALRSAFRQVLKAVCDGDLPLTSANRNSRACWFVVIRFCSVIVNITLRHIWGTLSLYSAILCSYGSNMESSKVAGRWVEDLRRLQLFEAASGVTRRCNGPCLRGPPRSG